MTTPETLKRINITIDPQIHEMGKAAAKADRRDFSSYVEWLVKEDLKRQAVPQATAPEVKP